MRSTISSTGVSGWNSSIGTSASLQWPRSSSAALMHISCSGLNPGLECLSARQIFMGKRACLSYMGGLCGGILARFLCRFSFEGFMAQKNKGPEKVDQGRRQFLKATGMAPLAAGVAGAAVIEAQSGPAIVGPGEVPIELMVNGK